MSFKNGNPRNHVVFDSSEMNEIRKYLKDIAMMSSHGEFPKYEIGKIANIIELGGETVENYIDELVK